jgi:hypothetical protein
MAATNSPRRDVSGEHLGCIKQVGVRRKRLPVVFPLCRIRYSATSDIKQRKCEPNELVGGN